MNENFFDQFSEAMNKTFIMVQANAEAIKAQNTQASMLSSMISNVSKQVCDVSNTVVQMGDSIGNINQEIEQLKLNEEITTTQHEEITRLTRKRIYELLGDDQYDQQKYYKLFSTRLYKDARRDAHLGATIARTHKRYYAEVTNYIANWSPAIGIVELKRYADGVAERRKKAKEEGYDV